MANLNLLKPKVKNLANQLITNCKTVGIDIIITQTLRTITEQDILYAQGRTTPGRIITNAKGGQSMHNYGCAFDFAPLENGKIDWSAQNKKWGIVGKIGITIGLEWGGLWTKMLDLPHFQYTAGYSLKDFQTNNINWNKFT